jgi:type IV secretory pathway TrbL component
MTISSVTQTITTPKIQGAAGTASGAAFQVRGNANSAAVRQSGTISAFNPYQSLSADLQSTLLGIDDSTSPTGATNTGQSGGKRTDSDASDLNTVAQTGGPHRHQG